jgi:regulator of RNase E activity RraA
VTAPAPTLQLDTLALLRRSSTATLTTQLLRRGFRQRFLVGVKPLNPAAACFAGEAFTVRFIPGREDLETHESLHGPDNLQWRAVETIPPGHVLVVGAGGVVASGGYGHILMTRLQRRGAAAAVTDGAFRDGPAIARMEFPAYATATTATSRLSFLHVADLQVPIGCAGVAVYPGDIMVGDAEGVVVVPRKLADEVAHDAYEQEQLEAYLLERIDGGEATDGVYPPSDATRAEYARSRGTDDD